MADLRRDRGLTPERLAEAVGVSENAAQPNGPSATTVVPELAAVSPWGEPMTRGTTATVT